MRVSPNQDYIEEQGHDMPTRTLQSAREYQVLAIEKNRQGNFLYVFDDDELYYPVRYSANIFRIIEKGIPKDWQTSSKGFGPFKISITSFKDWVNDLGGSGKPGFYERLVSSDEGSIEREIIKQHMDYQKIH